MPVSPETEQAAAYAAGRQAYLGGQTRESNPYLSAATPLIDAQRIAWLQGFLDALEDTFASIAGTEAPPPEDFVRRGRFVKVIPAAQVKASFSAPVTLVAGLPNAFLLLRGVRYKKAAGVAYVANGNTNWLVRYFLGSITIRQLVVATFLAQTLPTKFVERQGTTFGVGNADAIIGSPIQLALDTADMVTGDGDVTVEGSYDVTYL